MANKLQQFITAAGLSALLVVTAPGDASAQETKPDLTKVHADMVVVQVGGRSVFNTVSMPPDTTAAADTSQDADSAHRTPPQPLPIASVEDCLTASSNYVSTAATTTNSAATAGGVAMPQRGAVSAERGSAQRSSSGAGTTTQAFIATCYDHGRRVATITFNGTNDPVVELITTAPAHHR
ncbi:MAG: hypothetical protein H6858_06870 [Rhodospirillales bacterium]|nr:hypothetical protein [Alphaproteobacteria bacterium]MCB1838962.1 hypothetical protein [Alphaproteobacteria bacterium]MCB9977301.1 hypothetical protein [Rhodospirillales bacterium]